METDMIVQTLEAAETFNLNTVVALVCMVYIAFNLYFMLEKFKVKD